MKIQMELFFVNACLGRLEHTVKNTLIFVVQIHVMVEHVHDSYNFYYYKFAKKFFNSKIFFLKNATNFYCKCKSGITGPTCTIDIDECQIRPCKNGGKCINLFGSYKCICIEGFTGPDCSISMSNPCQFNKCSPSGSERCDIIDESAYECVCKIGYAGDYCEKQINYCNITPNACINGGTCINYLGLLFFL